MNKMVVAIFTCLSIATLGMNSLKASQAVSQEPLLTKETSVEKHCQRGPRGHRGHRGYKGHHGKQGPQGPAGTSAAAEFGEAYLISTPPDQIFIPDTTFGAVQFTHVGPLSSGVTYDPSTWTFTVNTAGTYTIEFDVKAGPYRSGLFPALVGPLKVKVVINGADQVATIVPHLSTANSFYAEASNQITRVLSAGETIQLQALIALGSPFFIYGIPGDSQEAAFISIEKIGE